MNLLAPIVLFVYNRPSHTRKTVEALQLNTFAKDSELFIFSDAPKDEKAILAVNEVRAFIKSITGFKSITIVEREENFGLVKSIKQGVTEIVNRFGKIIVLEDDLITHPQFLEFMNKGLELYKNDSIVFQITGYSHLNNKHKKNENDAYFLTTTTTWGWATWADRWSFYSEEEVDVSILSKNKILRKNFNFNNSYNYYKMLGDRQTGKAKSWGIVWYYNVFMRQGLTLHPTETLVDQIGFDGSGQNSKNHITIIKRIQNYNYKFIYPKTIIESAVMRKKISKILKFRKFNIVFQILKNYYQRYSQFKV